MFFFNFLINCVVHKRLKKLSTLETYGNLNNQQIIGHPINVNKFTNNRIQNQQSINPNLNQLSTSMITIPIQHSNNHIESLIKKDLTTLVKELERIFSLKEKGIINEEEFLKMKKTLIDSNC